MSSPGRVTVEVLVTPTGRDAAMIEDVRRGLTSPIKSIPPVWFYDEVGSRLFDEITRLPEYYLTRAEKAILGVVARQLAEGVGPASLVEIGSGTSEKTRLLLDAMERAGTLLGITLVDISEEVLREAAAELAFRYGVDVHAVVGDFRSDLLKLPRFGPQLWAFLGSTIGNFTAPERVGLLSDFQMTMSAGDHLLLGTDLVKDPRRLVAAYDDAAGVTAAFDRNVLSVLNSALDANFEPSAFEHIATWNARNSWIEMRLRSKVSQTAHIRRLGLEVDFAAGEDILTEISAKFERAGVGRELAAAGLRRVDSWTDDAGDFMLTLAQPAG
jgi:L-histidine N-alpha-methyltransferase